MAESEKDLEQAPEVGQTPQAQAAAGARSLEDILWSVASRWSDDGNELVDREEFAQHIFDAWGGESPTEEFVSRFFDGEHGMNAPADMAEAMVRASRGRMSFYEFDLNALEYVVIEEKDNMIVVSGAGEFALPADGAFKAALDAAIIPDSASVIGSGNAKLDRTDQGEPRAYFVQSSGEVVAVDVVKLSKAIADSREMLQVADGSMMERPASRLMPFQPRRKQMTEAREAELLRRDERVKNAASTPPPPPRMAAAPPPPPGGAEETLLLLMPDGTLARPVIGSASRWQDMLGEWATRSAMIALGATGQSEAVLAEQTFVIQSGRMVAVFTGGSPSLPRSSGDGMPGALGRSTEAQGSAIAAVRMLQANVRALNEDALAEAVAKGAKLVAGLSATMVAGGSTGSAFWIQPEVFFDPSARDVADAAIDVAQKRGVDQLGEGTTRQLVAEGYGEGAAQGEVVGGTPVQLGQVTGDPWADWALATGGELGPSELAAGTALAARRGRNLSDFGDEMESLSPPSRKRFAELALFGEKVVSFRSPDGQLMLQPAGAVRLAQPGRALQFGDPLDPDGAPMGFASATPIAARSGAIPQASLQALAIALERTAAAAGYKLPQVQLVSAFDAIESGDELSQGLGVDSPMRSSVRMVRSADVSSDGQVARMLLSMPFPSTGEVVVGSDLAEALQALLGAPVQPAVSGPGEPGSGAWVAGGALGGAAAGGLAGALALRGGGDAAEGMAGGPTPILVRGVPVTVGPDGAPLAGGQGGGQLVIDLGGQHQQAMSQAREALLQFEMPEVAQSLSSRASLAKLPVLLRRALAESGEWTPASGTALPLGVQQLALASPFDLPELVAAGAAPIAAPTPTLLGRPVNPGEEEIVIPMPLWAQMGRGRISETQQILASPRMPQGFAPPLGYYRLVAPPHVDMTGGAPPGTPGIETLRGPTQVTLEVPVAAGASGPKAVTSGATARMDSGQHILARIPIDDGETSVTSRGRVRVGAPLDAAALAAVASRRRRASGSPSDSSFEPPEGSSNAPGSSFDPGSSGSGAQGSGWSGAADGNGGVPGSGFSPPGADASSPGSMFGGPGRPSMPKLPDINLPDADSVTSAASGAGSDRTMAGALQSALKMSDSVSSRTLPLGPAPSVGNLPSLGGAGGATGFGSALSQGGAAQAASFGGAGPDQLLVGRAGGFGGSAGAGAQGGFASGFGGSAGAGGPAGLGELGSGSSGVSGAVAGDRVSSLAGSAPGTGTVVSGASSSASQATSTRWGEDGGASGSSSVAGLPPGAWSGADRTSDGYAPWNYSARGERTNRIDVGGVGLSQGFAGEPLPSLPTTLRFRYVGAPLWWNKSSIGGAGVAYEGEDFESPDSATNRTVRSALRAANSASSIWRSMLIHPSRSGAGGGAGGSELTEGGAGGSWDLAGPEMSLGERMSILAFGVGGGAALGAAAGKGSESVYIAMDGAGRAGTVPGQLATPRGPDSLQMSIVAAIPPSPPPLEQTAAYSPSSSMGGSTAYAEPRARGKKGHSASGGGEGAKSANEGVSHSKIEGSVDAIAQRIYHRIRRRIASDRERFGG